ncbi:type II toxin-antitoxin system RelE/ParE family toxin [Hoeflea ulvae]|uniref:Type II toxin-antitoxin system RelE/ParE family toxin n=1 Tax=Hoeflea ulvae TaxID=2983764 RepID=A0ABT3YEY5_9HYPH|nr:type II toxin-antitoxin system RelE/ParE family toxin [Hoeflea ulvae]MCY0094431.1 type II toxin-antitoxin system RelE/ParE family toxin [Hoeflea ulvae]
MIEVRQTEVFAKWLGKLRDSQAKARILIRIRRMTLGNPGDIKPVGQGVSELRVDYGPGYRIYVAMKNERLVVLLCGGDKSRQQADIKMAWKLAKEL